MIVRISGEDQYELGDGDAARLNELEAQVLAAVDAGREEDFPAAYAALLEHVRSHGHVLGADDLRGSDVILPPPDISYSEAAAEFTGEGLIPD